MTQSEKAARTRHRVLGAAGAVFSRRGYHHATLREIAEEAGVSKGALYYNFASKEDLFLALLDVRMDERLREIEGVFDTGSPEEGRVDRAALDYVENLKRNRDWIALFFEFMAHAARDGEFGERFSERFKTFWALLAEVVEHRARELDVELPLPAEHLAIAIDVTGVGFMLARIVDPDRVPDALLGTALGYMLRGVAEAATERGRRGGSERT
jgi:AcrR family transcriptional regulator